MKFLPKNWFQPPIRRRQLKYGLTPPPQHFRRRPRLSYISQYQNIHKLSGVDFFCGDKILFLASRRYSDHGLISELIIELVVQNHKFFLTRPNPSFSVLYTLFGALYGHLVFS
jgi:hypothetical protein